MKASGQMLNIKTLELQFLNAKCRVKLEMNLFRMWIVDISFIEIFFHKNKSRLNVSSKSLLNYCTIEF
jgi:hypothetical protein